MIVAQGAGLAGMTWQVIEQAGLVTVALADVTLPRAACVMQPHVALMLADALRDAALRTPPTGLEGRGA